MGTPHSQRHVWITGAAGLIGSALVRHHRRARIASKYRVTALQREELDLTNSRLLQERLAGDPPDIILHAAAMSRGPHCETDPELAHRVNVEVTQTMLEMAQGSRMIFLSTDLVFDGTQGNYRETDAVHPLSVYAKTKVEAEARVLADPRHLVVRTSLNGGISPNGQRSFNEGLVQAWKEGKETPLFEDEYRSPIHADETALFLWELIEGGFSGLVHLAGSERLSRLAIGQYVAEAHPKPEPKIRRAKRAEFQGPPRPGDTSLDTSRIAQWLGLAPMGLRPWMKQHPESRI